MVSARTTLQRALVCLVSAIIAGSLFPVGGSWLQDG
jgi:hypothetical protein